MCKKTKEKHVSFNNILGFDKVLIDALFGPKDVWVGFEMRNRDDFSINEFFF